MNNDMETMRMESEKSHGSKPKLRFPEFRDKADWNVKELCDVLTPVIRQVKKPTEPYKGLGIRSHGKGTFIKISENPENNSMEYLYEVQEDDLIINITFAWEGAIAIVKKTDNGALVSHRFPTYEFNKNIAIPEVFQYIILDKMFIYHLGVISPGGAGRNRVLNKNDFLLTQVLLPGVEEQQKISDCLMSLDELINAESQKLDKLMAQKNGLMEQLFPAEGETRPLLRFPEFRDALEWQEKKLGDICEILNGRRRPISSNNRKKGSYPYYGASGIVDFVNDFIFDERLLLIGEDGAKWGAFEKTAFIVEGKYWVNNHAHVLKAIDVNETLIKNYLTMLDLSPFVTGAAPPKLTLGKLKEIPVPVPASMDEQQKIADCLSSLDELIKTQSQKLDALKVNRNGLMQQLLSSPDELKL